MYKIFRRLSANYISTIARHPELNPNTKSGLYYNNQYISNPLNEIITLVKMLHVYIKEYT
jgi:hypothetical protein